jgi:uncharacterized protein
MSQAHLGTGVVYTETVIHAAPEAFVNEAPYQIAIVELENGERITSRILGGRAAIGDRVAHMDSRLGIPFFQKVDQDE